MQRRPRTTTNPNAALDTATTTTTSGSTSSSISNNGPTQEEKVLHPALASPTQPPLVVTIRAVPPWHAVGFIVVAVLLLIQILPTLESLDKIATIQTFTERLFPDLISVQQLAWIRAMVATSIWLTTICTAVGKGWIQQTSYLPASKLKRVPNTLSGIRTLYPFTSWSWNLLGLYFTLASYIAFQSLQPNRSNQNAYVHPILLRMAWIGWQIAAPCTLLVASVIRYAIWPGLLRLPDGNTNGLKSWRNRMMHNANVVFALSEACIWSGLPVRWQDAAYAPLWGVLYVLFSWSMIHQWNDAKHGPQFIYFFFDTTLPGYTVTKILFLLLVVLMLFFAIFCSAKALLMYIGGGILTHVVFVIALSSMVMRFLD